MADLGDFLKGLSGDDLRKLLAQAMDARMMPQVVIGPDMANRLVDLTWPKAQTTTSDKASDILGMADILKNVIVSPYLPPDEIMAPKRWKKRKFNPPYRGPIFQARQVPSETIYLLEKDPLLFQVRTPLEFCELQEKITWRYSYRKLL